MGVHPGASRAFVLGLALVLVGCSSEPKSFEFTRSGESRAGAITVLDNGVVRLRWWAPPDFDGVESVIFRRAPGSSEVEVGRSGRAAGEMTGTYDDALAGVFASGRYEYRVESRRAGEPPRAVFSGSAIVDPPLGSRLAFELLAREIDYAQLNEYRDRPVFEDEDEATIALAELGIEEQPSLVEAMARADVEILELPPSEGWRIDSEVEWQLLPWISRYAFEPRYRLLRSWTVTLRRGEAVEWQGRQRIGYGLERVGAPYRRVRRWSEDRGAPDLGRAERPTDVFTRAPLSL